MSEFQVVPQNSVNHRPTMALLSCSFDMMQSFARLRLLGRACVAADRRPLTKMTTRRDYCSRISPRTPLLAREFNRMDEAPDERVSF